MNPRDNKNLYTPLTDAMEDDMNRNSQPPAYHLPQQLQQQNQQIFPPIQRQYQPPATAPNVNPTTVIGSTEFGQIMMIHNPQVGPKPMVVTCPHCRARSKTVIRYRSTAKTHIGCLLLSWTMICCCLPYCMDSCQNANHFCSMCDTFIGTYQS